MRFAMGIGTVCIAAATFVSTSAYGQVVVAPRARNAQGMVIQKGGSYLGIGGLDITSDRAKALNLKEERGVEVSSVAEDGPAAKAGIKRGDVVLEYNGQPVEGIEQFQRMVRETPAGHQVKVEVWRNGAPLTLTATVEARKAVVIEIPNDWDSIGNMPMPPLPPMPSFDIPRFMTVMQSGMLGIEGEALGQEPQFAEYFGVKDGVLVKAVHRNSAAERAGIKAGDVIAKVGDMPVGSSHEITSALRNYRAKRTFNLAIVRNKKEMSLTVTLDEPAQ